MDEEEEDIKKVLYIHSTQYIVFVYLPFMLLFTFLLCCCLLVSRAAPAGSDEQSPLPEASKDLSRCRQEEEGRRGGADHVRRQLHPRVSSGAGGGPSHWSVSSCDYHMTIM